MSVPKPIQALLKWSPSGLGVFVTAHYMLHQSVVQTAIAALFTGMTALWVKFSDGFMKEAEQQAEKLGGSFAKWVFALLGVLGSTIRKWVVQGWWGLTADFEGKYYKRLEYVCRNSKTYCQNISIVCGLCRQTITTYRPA